MKTEFWATMAIANVWMAATNGWYGTFMAVVWLSISIFILIATWDD
jgi:hypothetical protein